MEERNCLSHRIADTVHTMLMCLDGKLSARNRVETAKAIIQNLLNALRWN